MHTVTFKPGYRRELCSASDCYADAMLDAGSYELEHRDGKYGARIPATVVCSRGMPRGRQRGDRVTVWVQFDAWQVEAQEASHSQGWSLR